MDGQGHSHHCEEQLGYITYKGPARAKEERAEKPMFLALSRLSLNLLPAHLSSNSMNLEMLEMKGMDEVIGLLDRDLPKEDAVGAMTGPKMLTFPMLSLHKKDVQRDSEPS